MHTQYYTKFDDNTYTFTSNDFAKVKFTTERRRWMAVQNADYTAPTCICCEHQRVWMPNCSFGQGRLVYVYITIVFNVEILHHTNRLLLPRQSCCFPQHAMVHRHRTQHWKTKKFKEMQTCFSPTCPPKSFVNLS